MLVWRLPTGLSTQRVSLWRSLRKMGAVGLTPGAAMLPYLEELQEQLDWLADEIERHDGDAWVLPVARLGDAEERRIGNQMRADREEEYAVLAHEAADVLRRSRSKPGMGNQSGTDKELLALQRRFLKVRQRDYFNAPGRRSVAQLIERCLALRRNGRPKALAPIETDRGGKRRALHYARASSR